MVEGLKPGSQVPIDSEEARNRALRDTYNPSDAAQALGHYGADAESRLQQTQQDATNLIGVTDNPLQMPLSSMRGDGRFRVIGEDGMEQTPAVASPTPQTPQMSDKQIGETIAANTTGKTEEEELDSGAGNTIQQSLKQAQEAQKKAANASMSSASMTNKDDKTKMLVGVV